MTRFEMRKSARLGMRLAMLACVLAGLVTVRGAVAQEAKAPMSCALPGADAVKTYYLMKVSDAGEAQQIQNAVRGILSSPQMRTEFVPAQNAIVVCAPPESQAAAAQIIRELDRPKRSFRVTYTFTETDGGKRVGTQHYALVVSNGQRTQVKEGSKVPLATGSFSSGAQTGVQTQFQYVDVGINFDATFTETQGGGLLKTKVEESSVVEDKSIGGVQEPVIRQSTYEGTPVVIFGKPAILNSLDQPNSARHVDVEVMVEEVK